MLGTSPALIGNRPHDSAAVSVSRGSVSLALDNFRVIRCTVNKVNSEVTN